MKPNEYYSHKRNPNTRVCEKEESAYCRGSIALIG